MLEIILMVVVAGKLKAIASAKGRSGWWAALGPGFWIAGEMVGAVIAASMGLDGLGLYGGALAGAALGAVASWIIVNALDANEAFLAEGVAVDEGPIPGGHYDPNNPYNPPGGNQSSGPLP